VRDAYLQRRRNMVYDGNPPDEDDPEPEAKPKQKPDAPAATPAAPAPGTPTDQVPKDSKP